MNDDILTHKKEDKNKAGGHVRRGSDPTNVKSSSTSAASAKPVGRTVGAIAAVATSALTTPLAGATASVKAPHLPNKRSSSTVSSDDKNAFHPQQKCSPHER